MNDTEVTGMVLSAMPVGEYDKRIVLLTRERGKISAFARGARRPGSSFGACCRPFSFGEFTLYEGRSAYTLKAARVVEYFEELSCDLPGVYYGFYFLDFAGYYSREGGDEWEMLKLLYCALAALGKESLDNDLVQAVFELKAMMINGDYSGCPPGGIREATAYAMDFVMRAPVEKLFTFTLSEEICREFIRCAEDLKDYYIHREFSSLGVLKEMKAFSKGAPDTIS
ncbi:MAG: DNA repair protein RecO [Lachnospiraceae bacterium]|nr:DNA repair protein RecO [Lachnospiraceae bacterium]